MHKNSTTLFVEECKKWGLPYTLHSPHILEVHLGKGFFCIGSRTPLHNACTSYLCAKKHRTKQLLDIHKKATAMWEVVRRGSTGFHYPIHAPFVIKPLDKEQGKDVLLEVQEFEAVLTYLHTHPEYDKVLVEEMLYGKEYRILILEGKVFSAREKLQRSGKRYTKEVLPEMSQEVHRYFEEIARIFHGDVLGIDVIMKDLSTPPEIKDRHGIVEINSAPGLYRHAYPEEGMGKNAAEVIFQRLVEQFSKNN